MIDVLIFTRLTGDAAVGPLLAGRVYPVRAPQDAPLPYITWAMVSRVGDRDLAGQVSDLVTSRFQVDCYAASYTQARALADAARRSLANWGDPAGVVRDAVQDNELDLTELDILPVEYRIEQDWLVTFTDT